jgi:hypothetical protein
LYLQVDPKVHEPLFLNWWQAPFSAAVGANATLAAGLRVSVVSERARELERPRYPEARAVEAERERVLDLDVEWARSRPRREAAGSGRT